MLISLAVSNFKSMRDRQVFSMERLRRQLPKGERAHAAWKRPGVSTVAAIYGSNAAGKSTLLHALGFLVYAVRESYKSWEPDGGTPVVPFKLDESFSSVPTHFEIEFVAEDGVEYQYGLTLNASRVLHEHLYSFRTHRRTVLFHREFDGDDDEWYFGPSFRGPALQIRTTTRSNALFLSAAAAAGNKATREAYAWLSNALRVYDARGYGSEHRHVIRRLSDGDDAFRAQLLRFLRYADLGVRSIDVVRKEVDSEQRTQLERLIRARASDVDDPKSVEEALRSTEFDLSLTHRGVDGEITFPFDWESDGTQALLSFASIAVKALETGAVCVVDEIDSSLHPLLVAELVNVFTNALSNPKQAQLIFTTHDVSLIGRGGGGAKALDRDQIWVVEKDQTGASTLIGISEYRPPRLEENLERGYLTGRFGGLPQLSIVQELVAAQSEGSE